MLIARVIGTTVSTIKDEKLSGRKLLILRQTDERGNPVGKPYVAVDTVDAGIGDLVLTCAGSSARQTAITRDTPVDAVIMSIIDSLEVDGEVVPEREVAQRILEAQRILSDPCFSHITGKGTQEAPQRGILLADLENESLSLIQRNCTFRRESGAERMAFPY